MDLPIDVWRHIISYNNPVSGMMLKNKDRDKLTPNYVCMYNTPKQTKLEYIKSNYKNGDIINIYDDKRDSWLLGVIVDMNPTRVAKRSHHYKLSYVSVIADDKTNRLIYNKKFNGKYYHYNFLKYNVKCVYANQVADKHKTININTTRINKYINSPDTFNDLSNLKQYDIINILYHYGNNIGSFNEQLCSERRIHRKLIVYTGDGRCMSYSEFLEYENPRGIKSHFIEKYKKNVICFDVLNEKDKIDCFDNLELNKDLFDKRVIKDQEQYYRRRLK